VRQPLLGNIFQIIFHDSRHPTTCSSSADILAVLFFHESGMHYYPNDPKNFASDRLVLSKGHAAPILYSMWSLNGHIPKEINTSLFWETVNQLKVPFGKPSTWPAITSWITFVLSSMSMDLDKPAEPCLTYVI
jgi:pyruvate dehydrogenase complex dehydrogenase (E1) component